MKIKYDRSVDAAYISLLDERDPDTAFGFTYSCDPSEVNAEINLDFDSAGRLLGIEVLQASKHLPLALLKAEKN